MKTIVRIDLGHIALSFKVTIYSHSAIIVSFKQIAQRNLIQTLILLFVNEIITSSINLKHS